jgi:lipoyl(octanoyl) transferase
VNVAMDLSPFADIDPCGQRGLAVTQLADFGVHTSVDAAGTALAPVLARHLVRPAPAVAAAPHTAEQR